jgi:hypothetical protein
VRQRGQIVLRLPCSSLELPFIILKAYSLAQWNMKMADQQAGTPATGCSRSGLHDFRGKSISQQNRDSLASGL